MNRLCCIIISLCALLLSACASQGPVSPFWDYVSKVDVKRAGNEYFTQLNGEKVSVVSVDTNYEYAGVLEPSGLPMDVFIKSDIAGTKILSMLMVSKRWGIFKEKLPEFPATEGRETLLRWQEGTNDTMYVERVEPTHGNHGQIVQTQLHSDLVGDNQWFNVMIAYSEPFEDSEDYYSWRTRYQQEGSKLLEGFKERAETAYILLPKQ